MPAAPQSAPWRSCVWLITANRASTKVNSITSPIGNVSVRFRIPSVSTWLLFCRDPRRGCDILFAICSSAVGHHIHGWYSRCFQKSLPGDQLSKNKKPHNFASVPQRLTALSSHRRAPWISSPTVSTRTEKRRSSLACSYLARHLWRRCTT